MAIELDKTCPKCKGEVKDHRAGCEECEQFQCAACRKWVVWDLGGEDDEENRPICNECWAEENEDGDDTADDGELEEFDDQTEGWNE